MDHLVPTPEQLQDFFLLMMRKCLTLQKQAFLLSDVIRSQTNVGNVFLIFWSYRRIIRIQRKDHHITSTYRKLVWMRKDLKI